MKRPIAAALLAISLTACYSPGERQGEAPIYVWEDPNRAVTCYVFGDGGTTGKAISFLPNREIGR